MEIRLSRYSYSKLLKYLKSTTLVSLVFRMRYCHLLKFVFSIIWSSLLFGSINPHILPYLWRRPAESRGGIWLKPVNVNLYIMLNWFFCVYDFILGNPTSWQTAWLLFKDVCRLSSCLLIAKFWLTSGTHFSLMIWTV